MLIYIVKKGDTLWSIARRYGVSLSRLVSDNGLTAGQRLVVGQALIIMLPDAVHTVRAGESVYSIAASYGITPIELMQNNPELAFGGFIQPGQQLSISFSTNKIREISVTGYAYPHINRQVLIRSLPFITYLSVFSYGFKEDGQLISPDDSALVSTALSYAAAPILVLSGIDENGAFSTEHISRFLGDTRLQDTVLENAVSVMLEKGYVGMDVDFEYISPDDADAYLQFLKKASERLTSSALTMNVDLAPKTYASQPGILYEAHDYPAIGAVSDSVLLMTYEWGYTYGPPMAVAPLEQVRQVVEYAVTEIPANKINMGIPNYGYGWTLPYEQGISKAENLGNQTAVSRAASNGAQIMFDISAQSPWYEYYRNGRRHIVWFEDVRSVAAKLSLADEYGLEGPGYWNLMRPFNQNWAYISAKYSVRKIF